MSPSGTGTGTGTGKEMWLIQAHGSNEGIQTFINPVNGGIEEKQVAEMKGKLCLASFEDWMFLRDEESHEHFLLNLNSMIKIHPPRIDEPYESLGRCTLSSSPTSPDCTIIFFGREDNFILLCDVCDKKWTKLPIDLDVSWIRTMLISNGQLYVTSGDDMAIIDISSLFTGNAQMTKIGLPEFCPVGCEFHNHIVESRGDLFLVRPILAGQGPPVIYFEVHRYDPSEEDKWCCVKSIGDRAFFLHQCGSISFCAEDVGVREDCIYCKFSSYEGLRIYEFCMSDQTMSFKLLPAKLIEDNYSFYWLPRIKFEDNASRNTKFRKNDHTTSSPQITYYEVCQKDVLKEVNRDVADSTSRTWSDLPLELVQEMTNYLPLKDCVCLPAVCSAWKELSNPIQEAKVWLLYSPKQDGTCTFFDPFEGKTHELCVEVLASDHEIRFLFSKNGWVIASVWDSIFYLLNPITQDYYDLPILNYQNLMKGIAFSSAPSSPCCVVFGITGVLSGDFICTYTWRHGQEEWSVVQIENDTPFYVEFNNPVFFLGEFYCLGKTGALGVYNPDNNTWRVLNKPAPIYSEKPLIGSEYCYLVEFGGELISVFRGHISDFVRVFKLDQSEMAWTELYDIGDLTLFLDYRASIARSFPGKSYRNKLYLPRLEDITDGGEFYYCMESRKHSLNFKSLREPYNCVWLEPNLDS